MRTRMSGGVGRVVSDDGPYPISAAINPVRLISDAKGLNNCLRWLKPLVL